jgi:hypothetical protein
MVAHVMQLEILEHIHVNVLIDSLVLIVNMVSLSLNM